MGSDLYSVTVVEKQEQQVTLRLEVVHPDAMHIPQDISFGLMLLLDEMPPDAPIWRFMDHDEAMESEWLRHHAKGFVRELVVRDLSNTPPAEARGDFDHPYWEDSSRWMTGTVTIDVTHPAWVEHFKPSMSFDSRAFAAGRTYNDRNPITPTTPVGQRLEKDPETSSGFLSVPGAVFLGNVDDRSVLPESMYFPAYSSAAYRVDSRLEGSAVTREAIETYLFGSPRPHRGPFGRHLRVVRGARRTAGESTGRRGQRGGTQLDSEVYEAATDSIVEAFEIDLPLEEDEDWVELPEDRVIDLHEMTPQEVRKLVADNAWPTVTVRVTVTHPDYLSHLQSTLPYPVP